MSRLPTKTAPPHRTNSKQARPTMIPGQSLYTTTLPINVDTPGADIDTLESPFFTSYASPPPPYASSGPNNRTSVFQASSLPPYSLSAFNMRASTMPNPLPPPRPSVSATTASAPIPIPKAFGIAAHKQYHEGSIVVGRPPLSPKQDIVQLQSAERARRAYLGGSCTPDPLEQAPGAESNRRRKFPPVEEEDDDNVFQLSL